MGKHKWFFKRGNARLSWETLPEWVQWVAVDKSGYVYQYKSRPFNNEQNTWINNSPFFRWELCAAVGHICDDWRDLLFKRPKSI